MPSSGEGSRSRQGRRHACEQAALPTLSSRMGLPMKMTMRCRWFLFCRCFRASCAICRRTGKGVQKRRGSGNRENNF